ncbi:MAG: tetratricopeptide (TPR) repeat protein, partial [Kiritimatiellia bacterium]
EAAEAWERALSLQPERGDLWLERGQLLLRLNQLEAAKQALNRAVRQGDSATERRARALLSGLVRVRLPATTLDAGQACPERVAVANCRALFLAMVYHRRGGPGDRQVALQHVGVAREGVEDWVRAINLQASIHRALAESSTGVSADRSRSLALYARSLELRPAQPSILVHLGKLHERNGEQELAVQRWQQAVDLGEQRSGAAHFYLGRHFERVGDLWVAQRHLDSYFAGANVDALAAPLHEQALQLRARVNQMIYLIYGTAGVGVAALFVAPAVWWVSRRPGYGLQRLLERAPSAWRDVARICSALRHEVLKHNTTLLDGVAAALDEGDAAPSIWAAERLFADDGAVPRFHRYVRELQELGRSHGVRLDLGRADPVMGPLCAAMARLSALRRPLERGQVRIADDLRALSRQLNGNSYRALGAFIRRMCLLEVEQVMIEQTWSMVSGEAAFVNVQVPDMVIELPDEAVWVRMFRGDLLDILANVLRNGLQASVEAGSARMAVTVEIDEDWITGLERVVFRVKDQVPARITTALIRSRYIERGLGLTVDMISRGGGSIHVEDEDGWCKAVVVRIPRAERPLEDA